MLHQMCSFWPSRCWDLITDTLWSVNAEQMPRSVRGVYKDQLHSSRRHGNPSFRPGSNATCALFFTFRVFGLRDGWHPVQISKQGFLKVNFNCEWYDTGQMQSGGKPLPPAAVRSLGSSYHACGFIQKASLFLTWHSATQWPSTVFWIFYQFMERGRKLNLG